MKPTKNKPKCWLTAGVSDESGVRADPAAHANCLVLDAPNAHVIQELFMESGLFAHTTTEICPVLSMDG